MIRVVEVLRRSKSTSPNDPRLYLHLTAERKKGLDKRKYDWDNFISVGRKY